MEGGHVTRNKAAEKKVANFLKVGNLKASRLKAQGSKLKLKAQAQAQSSKLTA